MFRDTYRTDALVFIAECGPFCAMQAEVYLLQKQLNEQVAKLHFRALWEHKFMALVRTQVKALVFKRNSIYLPNDPGIFSLLGVVPIPLRRC